MNSGLIVIVLLLTSFAARAQDLDGEVIADLTGESPYFAKMPSTIHSKVTQSGPQSSVLTLSMETDNPDRSPMGEYEIALFQMPSPKVTSSHYVISGEVAYQHLPKKSELKLIATYLQNGTVTAATDQDDGPRKLLEGSSDFRPFVLPVSISVSDTLLELDLNLKYGDGDAMAGRGPAKYSEVLSLRNVKLVQYQDAPAPSAPQAPSRSFSQQNPLPATQAAVPGPQILADLSLEKCVGLSGYQDKMLAVSLAGETDGTKEFVTVSTAPAWEYLGILFIPPELLRLVTVPRFGITGEIKTTLHGAIKMQPNFVARVEPVPTFEAPRADFAPSSDWENFDVQLDRGNSGLVLERLQLQAEFYGSGALQLRHLKLVQYPGATGVYAQPLASATPQRSVNWKSFVLGIAATILMLLALGGSAFAFRRMRQRNKERELRRIASLDG